MEIVEPVVNSLIVMGFMTIFGFIYCRREEQNSDSDEELTWNFSEDFVTQEATNFKELKGKVDEGWRVIDTIELRMKKIETFVDSGNLNEYLGN